MVPPLPFLYESTGVQTQFTNRFDPVPRSRRVFSFHRPETLTGWLQAPAHPEQPEHEELLPSTLRSRIQLIPPLESKGLWDEQFKAVTNLEHSLKQDRPRALIQTATGSGKTFTAVTSAYRLIKHADASRILFLVDRANLGRQALKEFQHYGTPDDGRKFTELYNVQHLLSNKVDPVARVTISTIQRLYAMLKGEELAEEDEEVSQFDSPAAFREPVPVAYNVSVPIDARRSPSVEQP